MAINDINVRFTEEKYDSKNDLIKDLKTSLVDNFWKNILEYRKQFNIRIGLHTFASSEYVLCNTDMTIAKNDYAEKKLIKIMNDVNTLFDEDYPKLEYASLLEILKQVALSNKLDNSDARIRNIVSSRIKNLDKDNEILPNYIKALNYIKSHYSDKIDIDFIHELHKILLGIDFSSFRNKDDDNISNRVLIDRIYTAAPISLIEPLTKEVCAFIENSELPTLTKAFIVYYAFASIKPFAKYSRELAILMAKVVIAKESMGEVILYIPLEKILNISQEDENKLFTDVQKYNDVTYFVRFALTYLDVIASDFIDKFVSFTSDNIENEFYAPEKEEEVVEEEEEIVEEVVEEKKVVKEEKAPRVKSEKKKEEVVELKEVAIRYIPKGLDEKEAAKLEIQLLEMDPSLKKKEAHFYAHHCTLGMNYTIQHYKRYCRVSYETARTSMDHLAELGYYRKEQIKNKFIYSPIKKD